MNEILAIVGAGALAVIFFILLIHYRNKYNALRKSLGKALTEVARKGGDDGLIAVDIHDQDIDFKFVPTLNREKGLYYLETKDGKKRHLKVLKKEIHFIRGRIPAIFLVNDRIRAVDTEIIKTLDLMKPSKRMELLSDWSRYTSLKDELAELEEDIRFASNEDRKKIVERMGEIEKELAELEQKWGVIFAELDANKAIAYFDEEDGRIHIIKTINFPEFVDFMTGVYDDEIEDIVTKKLNRKLEGILRDITERFGAFGIPDENDQGSDTLTKGIIVFFMLLLGIFFIGIVVKALGG
ncbi:MAG: hypothetical protein ACTSPB_22050 [Candidatus Thorarchaeota archaeon]